MIKEPRKDGIRTWKWRHYILPKRRWISNVISQKLVLSSITAQHVTFHLLYSIFSTECCTGKSRWTVGTFFPVRLPTDVWSNLKNVSHKVYVPYRGQRTAAPCTICIPPFGKEKKGPFPSRSLSWEKERLDYNIFFPKLFVHAKRGSRFFTLVLAYLYLQRKPLLSQELDSLIRWPLCGIHPRRPIRSSWSSAIYSARYHSNSCINFSHSVGVPTQHTSTLSTADSTCPSR